MEKDMEKDMEKGSQQELQNLIQQPNKMEKNHNIVYQVWRVIYPALLYLVVSTIVQLVAIIMFGITAAIQAQGDLVKTTEIMLELTMKNTVLILMVGALITIPLFIWLISLDRKKEILKSGKIEFEKPTMLHWLFIVILAITFCISLNGIITISRIQELYEGYEEVAEYIFSGGIWMQLLSVGIIVPIVEELIFRGLAYKRIERYGNWKIAMVISAVFFGLYHMNVVQFIYATLMGLLFAYLYHKMKTLWAPIILHCVANIVSVILTNVTVISQLWENNIFSIAITVITAVIGIYVWKLSTKINLTRVEPELSSLEKEKFETNYFH